MGYNLNRQIRKADLPVELIEAIGYLWDETGLNDTFELLSRTDYIMDSAEYFLNALERITREDYVPTVQDVLYCRVKTTGVNKSRFNMGKYDIMMYDVGGQRSERRKWIHLFDNVTSIIFCVSLSAYNQNLLENEDQNRLLEALQLFKSTVNSQYFYQTSIILFLNKADIFKRKIKDIPLKNYLSDYEGKFITVF
jgi:guanine nucleotide-binding protein subunit alpha